jgi:uncharacterized protein YcbK (DUF882 family)
VGDLTRHFSQSEFAEHDGIAAPTSSHPAIAELCHVYLEPLRERFGRTTVMSGYRSREYNHRVGGAQNSMHIYTEHPGHAAADVVCERGTPRDWYELLDRLSPGGLGFYSDHVHVDNRAGHARW